MLRLQGTNAKRNHEHARVNVRSSLATQKLDGSLGVGLERVHATG